VLVNEAEKRRYIDLHFSQNYALANGEQGDFAQHEQDRVIPIVKAYRLFEEGKNPIRSGCQIKSSRAASTAVPH
jgi:hypothetical protein